MGAPDCVEGLRGICDGLAPPGFPQGSVPAKPGGRQPRGALEGTPAELAPHADEPLLPSGKDSRRHAPQTPLLEVEVGPASQAAVAAGGCPALQIPHAGAVLEELVVEGPHGARGDAKPAEVAVEGSPPVGCHDGFVAPVDELELVAALELTADPHAAAAENAAGHVPLDERRLSVHIAGKAVRPEGRFGDVVADHQVLEGALARLVADGAFQGVIDEDELKLCPDSLQNTGRLGDDVHPVPRRGEARRDEVARFLPVLHDTEAAGPVGGDPLVVAKRRDEDACLFGGLQDGAPPRDGDLDVVDFQRDHGFLLSESP